MCATKLRKLVYPVFPFPNRDFWDTYLLGRSGHTLESVVSTDVTDIDIWEEVFGTPTMTHLQKLLLN
jgi:hypothetical protein